MIAPPKINMREEVLSYLNREGFTVAFRLGEDGLIDPLSEAVLLPETVTVRRIFHFESATDAAEMENIYALTTDLGRRGWIAAARHSKEEKRLHAMLPCMKGLHRRRR